MRDTVMEQDAHAPKAQTLIISTHANDGQSPAVVPFTEDDASCANGAQVNKYLKRKRRVATYTTYTKVEKLNDKTYGMDEGWGYFSDAPGSENSSAISKKKINRRTYEWNAENQMTGTTDESLTVNYTYGADGKRASKYTHSRETLYFNDYWVWHIDSATRSRGGKVTKNIYLGTERVASRIGSYNTYDGEERENTFFYHPDHLGSAQLVTDHSGNEYQRLEYTPYGETWMDLKSETSLITKLPYKFSAKELDEETGLYYYGARYLDPKMSRWISADPAMNTGEYFSNPDAGMGGIYNHVNFNLYHYAGNNPINYTDPDGRRSGIPAALESQIVQRNTMANGNTTASCGLTNEAQRIMTAQKTCSYGTTSEIRQTIAENTKRTDMWGVYAIKSGVVIQIQTMDPDLKPDDPKQPVYGNNIIIRDADGTFVRYAHLESINFKVGASVEEGTQIGIMGDTGRGLPGPCKHLHVSVYPSWAIKDRNKFNSINAITNPEAYIKSGTYPCNTKISGRFQQVYTVNNKDGTVSTYLHEGLDTSGQYVNKIPGWNKGLNGEEAISAQK